MKYFVGVAAILFTAALVMQWLRLPLAFNGVWMSPDETANAVAGVLYADKGTFRLPSPITKDFPWAAPRSFVALGHTGNLVPVGFLGMPFVLAIANMLAGGYGVLLFTVLFAILTLWALWKILPEKWSVWSKWSVLLVWISFPSVIIYANRGDFANLFVACLAVWLWYVLAKNRSFVAWPLAGAVLGLALAVRPPEALWLIPLVVFAILHRSEIGFAGKRLRLDLIFFALACLAVVIPFAYLGKATYGSWFVSGYQVRPVLAETGSTTTTPVIAKAPVSSIVAFDLHPKSIVWNAWTYLVGFCWPWVLVMFVCVVWLVKEKAWKKEGRWAVLAMVWTFVWLVMFYGNNLYQDHIGLKAAVGNSYLRYLLPISLMAAIAAGFLFEKLKSYWSLRVLLALGLAFLVFFGEWTALFRDAEGMAANQKELARYAEIRTSARQNLNPGTIVLSDRNDKVFFPVFTAVSPMPKPEDVVALLDKGYEVAIFTNTLSEDDLMRWSDKSLVLDPVFSNSNQTLYYCSIE